MRKPILALLLGVAISQLSAGVAGAQPLYGMSYQGSDGLSTLHTISLATGAATPVGAVGFERCGGMDFNAAGTLYATCERADGSNTPVLVTIDTTTGAGTEVGPTGLTGAVGDISFRPSDGVLFAYDATNDPDHSLFTIDTTTGASALVGDTGLAFAGGNGMGFDLADTLFQSQFTGGPSPDLNTLDPSNGVPTLLGQVTPLTGRFSALAVDPTTGVIYGTVKDGSGGTGPTSLATLDTVALTATVIGPTDGGLDAIAFQPAGPPPPMIPTLDLVGLFGLALALGAAGLWWIAARR